MKKMRRRILPVLLMLIMVICDAAPAFAAGGGHITFPAHMVGTKGKMAYFAIGIDGGGDLYSYNANTKHKKRIAKGKWCWLNIKGKYLYLTLNKHGGSDGRNYYIYRMKKNGKGRKKLANGFNPIVKGKYIYYIATKKRKFYGATVDGKQLGIYRMKLNGKGKKCLVKGGSNVGFYNLGIKGNSLVYRKDGKWYTCSLTGKKKKSLDIYMCSSNVSITDYDNYDFEDEWLNSFTALKASKKSYYYEACSGIVSGTYGDGEFTLCRVKGKVKKLILSGNHMMVVSQTDPSGDYNTYYNAFMVRKNGKGKKLVKKGVEVSGGWDY